VALNLVDVLIAAALVVVGCWLTYARVWGAFKQAFSELRRANELQINSLTSTLKALETRVAELSSGLDAGSDRSATKPSAAAPRLASVANTGTTAATPQTVAPSQEEVSPEILVMIAAAVTSFMGKKVRIRSARMLQSPYEIVNPWSQQGRVFIQASHNLR
jgi:hypothetical protein